MDVAAKGEPKTMVALNYYLDNYKRNNYHIWSSPVNIACIPAIQKGQKTLAKPLEVFSNPIWQSFGFPVLDPSLRQGAAKKLFIREHPHTYQLVSLLKDTPPTTEAQAHEWFGILSCQIPGLLSF